MRYCYCPECDKLRPRNWYSRGKCEICKGNCVDIQVNRTFNGFLMYLLDAVAVVFIGIYLFADSLTGGLGDFVNSLGIEMVAVIMFVLIGASLVFGYFDIRETTAMAQAKVDELKRRQREADSKLAIPDDQSDEELAPEYR